MDAVCSSEMTMNFSTRLYDISSQKIVIFLVYGVLNLAPFFRGFMAIFIYLKVISTI
jgi:hypothetical protein